MSLDINRLAMLANLLQEKPSRFCGMILQHEEAEWKYIGAFPSRAELFSAVHDFRRQPLGKVGWVDYLFAEVDVPDNFDSYSAEKQQTEIMQELHDGLKQRREHQQELADVLNSPGAAIFCGDAMQDFMRQLDKTFKAGDENTDYVIETLLRAYSRFLVLREHATGQYED